MRVKVSAKDYGIDKLEFGKRYIIAYAGCSLADEFLFTRHKMIEMCDIVDNRKVASYWISKRELKQLLRLGIIHFMCEAE